MRGPSRSPPAADEHPFVPLPKVAVPGRLHGIRLWHLSVDAEGAARLGSGEKRWRTDGECTWAECIAGRGHRRIAGRGQRSCVRPPVASCTCGLYAMHPPRLGTWLHLYGSGGDFRIAGIVEAWGTVQIHRGGFRAQYARPVALALIGFPRASDFGRLVEDLAIRHRAELLEFDYHAELANHCARNGIGLCTVAVEELLGERVADGPLRVN